MLCRPMVAAQILPKHHVSVSAAIIDVLERFLAIRRADNGRWEPPGGVLELDESIEEGLVREIAEETGLQVAPVALTGVYKNMARGIVALVFRCTILREVAGPTAEATEVAWMTRDELIELMDEAYSVRMLDAVAREAPHVRAHDGVKLIS